jgi:predicted dehydrogenase/threonine dehydrogenase-like Zn-dependent dehydrogenase
MKQIAQNYKTGELVLLDVPAPATKAGGVLVRSDYSLVSMGTEAMKIRESKLSLIGKARARPDQVKKVMQSVSQHGATATYKKVINRLDSYTPLGYSLSGVVVEVGEGVRDVAVGDRVACGGNLYALHAEHNWVPRNLYVPLPNGVKAEYAAFTTVGAIAMQGFRQSEAVLGEVACVIGLGLLGQILVQILRAAGVKAVGLDVVPERCRLAESLGAVACGAPAGDAFEAVKAELDRISGGVGADHIFLTASSSSNQPVEMAAQLARDRARVTDIGKCKLDLPWKDYYEKELDVRFSRSYGPGRYDPSYEEDGIDYPIGYVRWTERRNMACFLDLLASGAIDMEPLVDHIAPFEQAVEIYEQINSGELAGLGILFRYPEEASLDRRIGAPAPLAAGAVAPGAPRDRVSVGMIGCGNYASSMILPHLKERSDVHLTEVVTTTSLSAANAQKKFGFERASTDVEGMLADASIDTVMIMTRHSSHAALICQALKAGKTVFVEKPLAVSPDQLAAVRAAAEESGNHRLVVGFNRRFAPLLNDLKGFWGPRNGPVSLRYAVNAGRLESGSWYARADSEGPRFIGEGCHFVDTISWWLDDDPIEAFAVATPNDPDNILVTLVYGDGSIGEIAYLSDGDSRYPKEVLEVFGDGKVARLHNFERAEGWTGGKRRTFRASRGIDKGQRRELEAFIAAAKSGGDMPISFGSLIATTATTFAAVRSVGTRSLEPLWDRLADTMADPQASPGESEIDAAQ